MPPLALALLGTVGLLISMGFFMLVAALAFLLHRTVVSRMDLLRGTMTATDTAGATCRTARRNR